MSRLLDDLLAAARERSPAFADAEVDLAELAGEVADEYALLAAERPLRLDLRLAPGPVVVRRPGRAGPRAVQPAVQRGPAGPGGQHHHRRRRQPAGLGVGRGARRGPRHRRRTAAGLRPVPPRDPPRGRGTGLGLAIARQIVESHDGRLVLADRSGPGSTFVIWLPERAIAGAPERAAVPPTDDPLGERLPTQPPDSSDSRRLSAARTGGSATSATSAVDRGRSRRPPRRARASSPAAAADESSGRPAARSRCSRARPPRRPASRRSAMISAYAARELCRPVPVSARRRSPGRPRCGRRRPARRPSRPARARRPT